MNRASFLKALGAEVAGFNAAVSTRDGDWVVKGFIDIAKNIYTISVDTKVISKIMELLLFPQLARFARRNKLKIVLSEHQNFYPDISFVDPHGHRFALDMKSTYRIDDRRVNGMTLGAFTGYFRDRKSTKNISFPYGSYSGHFVLGIVYSRATKKADQLKKYRLRELESIASVIGQFEFFVHEKHRIASDRPGSGNTKNIGSVTDIRALIDGRGTFAKLGRKVFDDYWMYYLTRDMARAAELPKRPYTNLRTYMDYKGITK